MKNRTVSPTSAIYSACASLGLCWLLAGCAGSQPEAQTADNAQPETPAAPTLPEAVGAATCSNTLIDDLEDGDSRSVVTEDRGGYWYTYVDKEGSTVEPSGSFAPVEGGANGSSKAARMQGKMATANIVYAGIGFNLTDPMSPYDLSKTNGICFHAKGKGTIRFKLPDVNTAPEGKQCTQCYNDFGVDLTLTEDWKEYCYAFADLRQQPYWGEPKPALTTTHVFAAQWQSALSGQEYDLWLDDIRLQCE